MTRRTRLFLLSAGTVLIAGTAAGLVASYFGFSATALSGSNSVPELSYVPADVNVVAYVNVRQLTSAAALQRLPRKPPQDQRTNDFEAQTGISPARDIDVVLMTGGGESAGLFVSRGRFDLARIEGSLREHGAQVTEYEGERIYTYRRGAAETAVAFVEPGLALSGDPAAVRRAIDAGAGRTDNIRGNDKVMALIRDVDHATLWSVGRFDAMMRARLPENISRQLPPINWFATRMQIDGSVEGSVRVEARDAAAAQNFGEVVQGFVALGRLQSGRPELATLLKTLQLSTQGSIVSLDFTIPSEAVEDLANAMRRKSPHGASAAAPAPAQ